MGHLSPPHALHLLGSFASLPLPAQVVVPLPDEAGRRDILAVHMRNVSMASPEECADACRRLAQVTQGVLASPLLLLLLSSPALLQAPAAEAGVWQG